MPGTSTRTKTRQRDSVGFQTLQMLPFTLIASLGANVANTTIQDTIFLPCSAKILGAYAGYSTLTAATGTHRFNVVAGVGTYVTATGGYATDFLTVATPATGDIVNINISVPATLLQTIGAVGFQPGVLGNPPVAGNIMFPLRYTVLSTDTTATILAASITTYINQQKALNQVIFANSAAGVVNTTALQPGTSANSITLTTSVTGAGGTTSVANAAAFAGGTATTGTVIGVNEQSEYTGTMAFAPAGAGALGATPIFNSDMPLFTPPIGQNPWSVSNFDVIYQQGTPLTLRVVTPGGGATTNLRVTVLIQPFDVLGPNPTFNTFDPHLDIA